MTRLGLLICGALLATMGMSNAQSVKLDADEIATLLTGNTAIGRWEGTPYRQFFGPDGITLYAQKGARTARGNWRVDAGKQEYQSIWPGDTQWEGWFVMAYGGTYYWVSKATPPTPFRIVQGEQLTAIDCAPLRHFAKGGAAPSLFGTRPSCTRSKTMGGGHSEDCRWDFAYRSERVRSGFAKLAGQMQVCADRVGPSPASRVNHPDSHEQMRGRLGDAEITLSLKDKAALSRTLIFLRRTRPQRSEGE